MTLYAVLVALVFWRSLLTMFAHALIVDEPVVAGAYMLVINGNRRFDVAAETAKNQPVAGVLLIEGCRTTLVESGIVPRRDQIARRELQKRGVSFRDISTLAGEACDYWAMADRLRVFLADRNDHVTILANRFGTRQLRYILDRELSHRSHQVQIKGLGDRRCDENNWWTTRSGFKNVFRGYVELMHVMLGGRTSPQDQVKWNVAGLDRWVNDSLGPGN